MKNNEQKSALQNRLVLLPAYMLVIVFVLAGFGCEGKANDVSEIKEPANTGGEPAGYNGPSKGEVVGKGPVVFERTDDIEASIEGASLGRVFLKFAGANGAAEMETELPAEALEHLNAFFKKRLKYTIEKSEKQNPTADTETKRDTGLIGDSREAKNQLLRVEIDAPRGKRKISNSEANDLIKFVSETAIDKSK